MGTGNQFAAVLLVEIVSAAKPRFELMTFVAVEAVLDHAVTSARTVERAAKSRAFFRFGILRRASAEAAGSISASTIPGSSLPASATTRPHGSMMIECP